MEMMRSQLSHNECYSFRMKRRLTNKYWLFHLQKNKKKTQQQKTKQNPLRLLQTMTKEKERKALIYSLNA